MALRGSFSRSLLAAARSAPRRSSTVLRPPPIAAPATPRRRPSFRNPAVLGCTQSLLPLHNVVASASLTSHLSASARAWCELSQGGNGKDG